MKTKPNIIMLTTLIASAVAANAISYPPVLMPEDEFAGRTAATQNTYHIDGRVYTVWEAPPYPFGPMSPEHNDAIRIRIRNITPGTGYNYPDEWFTPELLATNAGKLLTQEDYAYVMANFWELPLDIVAGFFDGLYYDTAEFTDDQIIDYLTLVSLATGFPEREEAGLFGGGAANDILTFALLDNHYAYRIEVPLQASSLAEERRRAIRKQIDWSVIDFGFSTIFGADGAQLKGQDFSDTNVTGTQLQKAARDMDQTNLSGLDLAGLDMTNRTFRDANLSGSSVTPSQLKAVVAGGLTGVNLAGTGITRAMLAAEPNRRPPAELATIQF